MQIAKSLSNDEVELAISRTIETKGHFSAEERGELERFYMHEVRNLVGAIELFSAQLESQVDRGFDKESIKSSAKRVRKLSQLIIELTSEYNTSHRALTQSAYETHSLLDVIHECRESLQIMSHARAYNLVWQFQSIDSADHAKASRRHMIQILFNLVLNAMDAGQGSADKRIWITFQKNEKVCLISVSDKAGGIELTDIEPRLREQKHGSWGVGLMIVKKLLQEIGGQLEIVSINNGSTFRFSVPLQAD